LEVAGGGIAGLTVGLAFARNGWSVRVHEQDEQLRIPGAGIYIWENGLRVLETLGVLGAVSAGAIPATRHEKRDHDGTAFASAGFSPAARMIVPLRTTLLTAQANALVGAGGELVFGSRAVGAPCTAEMAYVQLTSVEGDVRANRVPIDRRGLDFTGACLQLCGGRQPGPHSTSISGPEYALPRLLRALVRRLFLEQEDGILDALRGYDELDLVIPAERAEEAGYV
jgi:hypothetical protein